MALHWGTSQAASTRRQILALPQPLPLTPACRRAGVLLPALSTSPRGATAAQDIAGPCSRTGGGQFWDVTSSLGGKKGVTSHQGAELSAGLSQPPPGFSAVELLGFDTN